LGKISFITQLSTANILYNSFCRHCSKLKLMCTSRNRHHRFFFGGGE